MLAETSPGRARDRYTAYGVTWLAYATYYLGRKGFSVTKKTLSGALGMSEAALGLIDAVYLAAYALGQFGSGALGDRSGARRLVGYGMLAAAVICAGLGSVSGAMAFGVLFCLNGFAQSTGWPGTTRAMAEWTVPETRGAKMAWWATCYQVGGLVATPFAGELLELYGWRAAFHVPAVIIGAVGILVLVLLKQGPTLSTEVPGAASSSGDRRAATAAQRAVLRNPTLWFFGLSYFFIKFIRYTLLFWLPYFLSQTLAYGPGKAAWVSSAFEAGGTLGVIAIGNLSDRVRIRRSALSAMALVGLGLALIAYAKLGGAGVGANVILFALVGALLFGPDSLLSGAAAQDAGGPAAAMATGLVNGLGSIGAVVTGLLVPLLARVLGWHALFPSLVVLAFAAALALTPTFRRA
jgi:sugar phosphate permease